MTKFIPKINSLGKEQEILKGEDYTISYAYVGDTGVFNGDTDYETAIVANVNYYILNGDHRAAYEKCESLDECMDYFNKNQDQKSSWSN